MLAAGPCTFSCFTVPLVANVPSLGAGAGTGAGRGSWQAGRLGTATAGRMGHGVHAAGCWPRRSAATGGAHWATHTGQHTLGMGRCPGRKVLVPAPLFACCRVLVLCAAALTLAGIMAAASAHQVCEASNLILALMHLCSFPVLYYSCPALRMPSRVTAVTSILQSSVEWCSSALQLLPSVLPPSVYKYVQDAAWSTSRSKDACCSHLLQAAAWQYVHE